MQESITIQKHPQLPESSDYNFLRKKGLDYIEQLSSAIWTDYNIHDPGITILELLCYAITDLGYRTSLDIKDLIAEKNSEDNGASALRQGFFTAADILTINPWTGADYRKLLIDVDGIKNAWLRCKQCACEDMIVYANCTESKLQYEQTAASNPVIVKGFYDVLVEFETREGYSDLNSGKIKYNFIFPVAGSFSNAMIEMRLPSWQAIHSGAVKDDYFAGDNNRYETFLKFINPDVTIVDVSFGSAGFISGNRLDNVDMPESRRISVLRNPVYATLTVTFQSAGDAAIYSLLFSDIPLRIWFHDDNDRREIKLADIKQGIGDSSASGIFSQYHALIQEANSVMKTTFAALHQHRNLSEDYCSITAIKVQDVGVCADIDVEPYADIEAVLAEAYLMIDQYLAPDIKFYSLKQLMDEGVSVDDIFEGPHLHNGFIKNDELEKTGLRSFVYSSDIINLLMDIPGIKSVRNFVLTNFDADGRLTNNEQWVLAVLPDHQPRLYLEASKILVYKNGLPFLPDKFELNDTLQVLKGQNSQPKFSEAENDLPVPVGKYYELNDYYPVQYSLPVTYGVSEAGLPSTATAERIAQAKQLKAYLIFFEQILVNYLEQLSHVKELFALDKNVAKTYFTKYNASIIADAAEIFNGLDEAGLQSLYETREQFADRRNRFLDHMLARFAESFNDYALMLYSYSTSKAHAADKLISDKIRFLNDLPFMSANRGRAINYKDTRAVCSTENISGLQLRIQRLLGLEAANAGFELYEETDADGFSYERRWRLRDETGKIQLSASTRYVDETLSVSEEKARAEIKEVRRYITDINRYEVKKVKQWVVNLTDETTEVIATRKQHFKTKAAAEEARDQIIEFGKKLLTADKVFVVEHLLLRPRNLPSPEIADGDPLLTICIPPGCNSCGDHDPYSFRVTVVLSGEDGIANSGIEFRRFAEQTIRQEIPAHLAVKICWVSNKQLVEFEQVYCAWLAELAKSQPDKIQLHNKLKALLEVFEKLKSVYPPAKLHDCVDGDDSNRVFLDNTII